MKRGIIFSILLLLSLTVSPIARAECSSVLADLVDQEDLLLIIQMGKAADQSDDDQIRRMVRYQMELVVAANAIFHGAGCPVEIRRTADGGVELVTGTDGMEKEVTREERRLTADRFLRVLSELWGNEDGVLDEEERARMKQGLAYRLLFQLAEER